MNNIAPSGTIKQHTRTSIVERNAGSGGHVKQLDGDGNGGERGLGNLGRYTELTYSPVVLLFPCRRHFSVGFGTSG